MALRIASLLPAATEIVCALHAESELYGISHECDFPASIRDRVVLTRSRIDTQASSRAIDGAVRDVIRDALSLYAVDEPALSALDIDMIVTQDLCEVCAVSLDDVRAAVARLAHKDKVEVLSLRATRLVDVLGDIDRVGRALGREDRARALHTELSQRLQAIAVRAGRLTTRPRVVSLEWIDPLMVGGTWMPELITLAGGVAAGAKAGAPARTIAPEGLPMLRPDVVVVKPCGFSLERTRAADDVLEGALAALDPRTRVYLTDGNAYFNRPGPRLVESLEIMAACVHPEAFEDLARAHASVIHRWR